MEIEDQSSNRTHALLRSGEDNNHYPTTFLAKRNKERKFEKTIYLREIDYSR